MAEPTPVHLDRTKPKMGQNRRRKARVIAKIRGITNPEAESRNVVVSVPWISVNKPHGDVSESVTVTFADQSASRRESYEIDFCYEQHEGNDLIFSREVKPLIAGVFDGHNATIIACGARGSGKTYMIQGTAEELGLAALTIAEILPMAEDNGKSIKISVYEIFQDHVYDLLDPKRQEVFILEDGQGKIQLKRLSQVPVTSISEFQKLYVSGCSSRKPLQKIATELPHRSHKGLMIYVSSLGETSNTVPVGKINFVDLTGYEDPRRKSSDGLNFVENTKINKSIYALQNVICSLNAHESRVPYRESKLTRMLQDSLGGASRILMVSCLNPIFCQDSINVLSLASRSCHGTNRAVLDSMKKANSSARSAVFPSQKSRILGGISTGVKKQTVPRVHFSEKKANGVASALKARRLFDETSHLKPEEESFSDIASITKSSLQEEAKLTLNVAKETAPSEEVIIVRRESSSDIACTTEYSLQEEEKLTSKVAKEIAPSEEEDSSSLAIEDTNSVSAEEALPLAVSNTWETTTSNMDVVLRNEDKHEEVTPSPKVLSADEKGKHMEKENNSSLINESGTPPISARLQELSNNLKSLYFSTPTHIEMASKNDTPFLGQALSTNVLKLGTLEQRANETREVASFCSPWETFSAETCGVKKSLVQEYLKFLNSASKEELKKLKGIGEKRATYILELREESPEPFTNLDDLKDIGLSSKQIKKMMKEEVGGLFD